MQDVWLESIAIRDFRNLERVDLELPAEGIALIGDNGHGKTNFLEAIYYLQILRSVRDARDPDVTRFYAPGFHISESRSDKFAIHNLPPKRKERERLDAPKLMLSRKSVRGLVGAG